MWLRDPRRDVIRVGRLRVERWCWSATGLVCARSCEVPAVPAAPRTHAEAVASALARLLCAALQEAQAAGKQAVRRLHHADLVVESAWLPIMLIDTGPHLWKRAHIEALARHRLARLHEVPGESIAAWHVLVEHSAGDRQALVFGLSPAVHSMLVAAGAKCQIQWSSLQPAFAWGWQRLRGRRSLASPGWWLWLEQDRTLLCHVGGGRLKAMNAGAALTSDAAQCRDALDRECLRLGLDTPTRTCMIAGWHTKDVAGMAGVPWATVVAIMAGSITPQASALPLSKAGQA